MMARAQNIRRRGSSWVVYFRVNGRQVQRSFADRDYGDNGDGTKAAREAAKLYLAQSQARKLRGQFRAPVNANVTFGEAALEWLRHGRQERDLKQSTLRDYESVLNRHLLPAFGPRLLREISPHMIEGWRERGMEAGELPRRTANKCLAMLHGIFERARKKYGFHSNPCADVKPLPERYSGDLDFYAPEEVHALVRAAASEQDGAIYLTAALTGLRRGELVALRVRDVDFERETIRARGSVTYGMLSTPKSGKVRSVPMVLEVAQALASLLRRERWTGDDDPLFPGVDGGYLDASALRRRYMKAQKAAGLRPLKFHDLRHTFGSLAIDWASIVDVQEWLGHADVQTTMRYLHHKSRADDAKRLGEAFKVRKHDPLESLIPASGPASIRLPGDGYPVPSDEKAPSGIPLGDCIFAAGDGTTRQP
jgi:integrase